MQLAFKFFVLIVLVSIMSCSDGGKSSKGDRTPAEAIVEPSHQSIIVDLQQPILVIFNETMSDSVLLDGTMADESNTTWTESNLPNDTLQLSPKTQWSENENHSLSITAGDLANNPTTVDLIYRVDATGPQLSVTPDTNTTLTAKTTLRLEFSEAVNPNELFLAGTLLDGVTHQVQWIDSKTALLSVEDTWIEPGGSIQIDATDTAGNAMVTMDLEYEVDNTLPYTLSLIPENGAIRSRRTELNDFDDIQLVFSETMDTDSLQVSGDLAQGLQPEDIQWSATHLDDDSIVITLSDSVSKGRNKTLQVQVKDVAGNEVVKNLTYDINVIYVDVNHPDAGRNALGSKTQPVNEITHATLRASQFYRDAEVHVAAGTYTLPEYPAQVKPITLYKGVSLIGGYAQGDWNVRDPAVHVTEIIDSRVGEPDVTIYSIFVGYPTSGTELNVIDGIKLSGPQGYDVRTIYSQIPLELKNSEIIAGAAENISTTISLKDQATLFDNTLYGGNNAKHSQVIRTSEATVTIERNRVINGIGMLNSNTGIELNHTHGEVSNNFVFGGRSQVATGYAAGVYVYNSDVKIWNNTINSGLGSSVYAIRLFATANESANSWIENNLIFTESHQDTSIETCIGEASASANPEKFNNNALNCGDALYIDYTPSGGNCMNGLGNCYNTQDEINLAKNTTQNPMYIVENNIEAEAVYINESEHDYRLFWSCFNTIPPLPMTPISILEGGKVLKLSKDIFGQNRTIPWSIGAFEKDRNCKPPIDIPIN